jgi:hypothetical protein
MVVDKDEILRLLHTNFTTSGEISIDNEGLVSCTGGVILVTDVTHLPVRFGDVAGDFYCSSKKKLISLEGAPQVIGGDFWCDYTKLTSLAGAPQKVRDFRCRNNQLLKSLEGGPVEVLGNFYCSQNPLLSSLQGAPASVGGDFWCYSHPKLRSLEGFPAVGDTLHITYKNRLPLLRTLMAKKIEFYPKNLYVWTVEQILNKYAGQGEAAAFECGAELASEGFKENARW